MSNLDRDLLVNVAVGLYVCDSIWLGLVNTAVLRLTRRGGWYRAPRAGEHVMYRAGHGVNYGGIAFRLPMTVVVSDRRFSIRIAWSRAALVNIPLEAVRSVHGARWWWYPTVVVAFVEGAKTRTVDILTSEARRTELMAVLRSVGGPPLREGRPGGSQTESSR